MARWPLDVATIKSGGHGETGRVSDSGFSSHGVEAKSARFGKYILLEKLGQGGMAEVHRATMTGPRGFQKTVALKRILPMFGELDDFRERFIEEARVAADLTHSNIVHVYDFGEIAGTYYISMELVDGMDADELVHLALNVGEGMRVAAPYVVAQAARGLAFAHAAQRGDQPLGLVHRDVSPQNILISRTGEVKVTDFGIVKVTTNNVNRLTATGAIMGKLRYMSPEQAMKLPLDGRSDIFALGLVLYELLTGAALLDAPSPAAVIDQLKGGDFPPPSYRNPDVPPDLDAIVANSLALDRESRYGTADDLARDLERHLRVMGGGFGREELRALVGRLVPAQAAARRERWQRQNAEAVARLSPWLAVGSDPDAKERREPAQPVEPVEPVENGHDGGAGDRQAESDSRLEPITQEMDRSESPSRPSAQGLAAPAPAAVPGPGSRKRFRLWLTLGIGVLVGVAIVLGVLLPRWRGQGQAAIPVGPVGPVGPVSRVGPVGPAGATPPPIASPLPVAPADVEVRPASEPEAPPPAQASPAEASAPATAETEAPPQRRHLLDGKPVVTDDDALGSVARDPSEARALANARAATQTADHALAAGNLALAERLYQTALDHYPGYVSAYRGLGRAYARDGNPALAQKMFDQYLHAVPDAADAAKVRRWSAQLARDPDRPLEP